MPKFLYRIKSLTIIIDISSFPYGVDFVAEAEYQGNYSSGLPGKVAPKLGKI